MTDKIESTSEFWIRRCKKFEKENIELKAREKKLVEMLDFKGDIEEILSGIKFKELDKKETSDE